MFESIVGAIASPIFEQLWKLGENAIKDIQETYSKVEATNKLIDACKRYEQRYRDRHSLIRVMPGLMKEPVPLESVYTTVKLLDEERIRYFRTEQDLEETYRKSGRRSFQLVTDKRIDGMAIAGQKQFLMVLGGPGIGKSTFLRKLGIESLKPNGQLHRDCIPVFIELKELRGDEINLLSEISKEFAVCGFPGANAFVARALEQGKLLILLDGLDEVPKQNINQVTESIEDFVDQYDKNCFVTSCRIAAYDSSFRRFTDVTIAEFDNEQIEQFIMRWFNSELDQRNKTAERYWKLLSHPEHKATRELAQTPLLLTFLCLVYDREQTLPQTRSTLYGDALNILLKEWAAQKRLEPNPIYEGFHPDLEKELLAQIAHDSFQQDQLFFSKAEITSRITEFLSDTLEAPKYLDGEAVLKAIEIQQGILVERASNAYSFSHLTIQEYLTAQYIVDHDLVAETVKQYVLDERWREVFLLMAGLLRGKVQQLLLELEKSTFTYVAASQKLKHLIQWAESITDTAHKSLHTRSAAIGNARVFARAFDIARDSNIDFNIAFDVAAVRDRDIDIAFDIARDNNIDFDIAFDIARDIALVIAFAREGNINFDIVKNFDIATDRLDTVIKTQIFKPDSLSELLQQLLYLRNALPEQSAPSPEWEKWSEELIQAWLNGFVLTQKDLVFSKEDAEALAHYFYITELIIRCKESAVRVSRREWEKLESRLLTLDADQTL